MVLTPFLCTLIGHVKMERRDKEGRSLHCFLWYAVAV
jgi:hypothetical protein